MPTTLFRARTAIPPALAPLLAALALAACEPSTTATDDVRPVASSAATAVDAATVADRDGTAAGIGPAPASIQQADMQFLRRDIDGDYFFDELLDADGTIHWIIVNDRSLPPAHDAMLRVRWRTETFEQAGDNSTFEAASLVDYTPLSRPPYADDVDDAALLALVEALPQVRALSAAQTRLQRVPNPHCPPAIACDAPYDRFADIDVTGQTRVGDSFVARFHIRTVPLRVETVAEGGGEPIAFARWQAARQPD